MQGLVRLIFEKHGGVGPQRLSSAGFQPRFNHERGLPFGRASPSKSSALELSRPFIANVEDGVSFEWNHVGGLQVVAVFALVDVPLDETSGLVQSCRCLTLHRVDGEGQSSGLVQSTPYFYLSHRHC